MPATDTTIRAVRVIYAPHHRDPQNIVEAYIARALRPMVARFFPQLAAEAVMAEWWLHSRAHTANHQLHYDTDEQRLRRGAGVHCPSVSTIVYLDAGTEDRPLPRRS